MPTMGNPGLLERVERAGDDGFPIWATDRFSEALAVLVFFDLAAFFLVIEAVR